MDTVANNLDRIQDYDGGGMAHLQAGASRSVAAPSASLSADLIRLDHHRFINQLYRSCWSELCGWLRRRFGAGPPEPEDVAQAAFRKIAEVEDFSAILDPRAFLYTVAARTAVSGLRHRSRTQAFIDRELQENGAQVEEITPERICLQKERLRHAEEALAELSPIQREIVYRSRVLGQTYMRISEETGLSQATISRHLQSALMAVSRGLGDDSDGTL